MATKVDKTKFISRKEITDKYGLHYQTIQQWESDKKIKHVKKIGLTYYYRRDDIDEFIARNNELKRIQNSEVYSVTPDGKFEHGFALSLKGWRAYQKNKSLNDVPPEEIIYEYFRPIPGVTR